MSGYKKPCRTELSVSDQFGFVSIILSLLPMSQNVTDFSFRHGVDQAWLMSSPLSIPLNFVAVHTWIVVSDKQNRVCRWEVWEKKIPIEDRWGYVHRNLFDPFQGIAINPFFDSGFWTPEQLSYWEGDSALRLGKILAETSSEYPLRGEYRCWPGPNSNTYIQWVLNQFSQNSINLPGNALGAEFANHAPVS
jgi:hypothetical protein